MRDSPRPPSRPPSLYRRSRLIPAAAVALLLGSTLSFGEEARFKSGTFEPARAAPDFALEGSDGRALSLARFRGKVVVLEFGFTHCPQICPMTLARLTELQKRLGAQSRDVQVLFLTVDPERDDAARLRQYLRPFSPKFIGGTGTPAKLNRIRRDYGVFAAKSDGGDRFHYQVHHSSSIFLIDRRGLLRALAPFGKSVDEIAHDVRLLLAEIPVDPA